MKKRLYAHTEIVSFAEISAKMLRKGEEYENTSQAGFLFRYSQKVNKEKNKKIKGEIDYVKKNFNGCAKFSISDFWWYYICQGKKKTYNDR